MKDSISSDYIKVEELVIYMIFGELNWKEPTETK